MAHKIFYQKHAQRNLTDFGIEIPLLADRILMLRNFLEKNYGAGIITSLGEGQKLHKADLELAHTESYVKQLFSGEASLERCLLQCYECVRADGTYNRYDKSLAKLPLAELFQVHLYEGYGTYQALLSVLEDFKRNDQEFHWSFYLGGGMHHARPEGPGGFCLYNDLVVAAHKVKKDLGADEIWVVDVDAHMGDGTAAFSQKFPFIKSFSIHMANGWPLGVPDNDGARPHIIPSSFDVGIKFEEAPVYNQKLRQGLEQFGKKYKTPSAALVVLGADPYEKDVLPSTRHLLLSLSQMLERDQIVFNFFKEQKIPTAFVMGGGYGQDTYKVYQQFLQWALT